MDRWLAHNAITDLRHLLLPLRNCSVTHILRSWNDLASSLAYRRVNWVPISLFHRGLEKPQWLLKAVDDVGFNF